MNQIVPSLWFDNNAEEAMNYYVSVFKNSRIVRMDRYPDESLDEHFASAVARRLYARGLTEPLDEPPTEALVERRGVLLPEHEWRVRERHV